MMKVKRVVAATMAFAVMACTPAFANGWHGNAQSGWWYGTNDTNSTWYNDGWHWIDGDGDGYAERYYFNSDGYLLVNTVTPDNCTVNADGAWTINGAVQYQQVSSINVPVVAYDIAGKRVVVYGNMRCPEEMFKSAMEKIISSKSQNWASISEISVWDVKFDDDGEIEATVDDGQFVYDATVYRNGTHMYNYDNRAFCIANRDLMFNQTRPITQNVKGRQVTLTQGTDDIPSEHIFSALNNIIPDQNNGQPLTIYEVDGDYLNPVFEIEVGDITYIVRVFLNADGTFSTAVIGIDD